MIYWQVKASMMCEDGFISLIHIWYLPRTQDPVCKLILCLQSVMMRATTNKVTVQC